MNQELDQGPPAVGKAESWSQLSKLIDEKQALARRHRALQEEHAKLERLLQHREGEIARLRASIDDARSILRAALREPEIGVRRGVRVTNVRSALLALGDVTILKAESPIGEQL